MASQGPLSGASFGGAIQWSNKGNIAASDDSHSERIMGEGGGEITGQVYAHNFGFTIPGGATIDGIVAEIERHCSSATNNPRDSTVSLMKTAGTATGSNKASGTTWPTSDAYVSYGGLTDLWATTWTPAEINDTGFGLYFEGQRDVGAGSNVFRIDHMRLTVYYTPPSARSHLFKTRRQRIIPTHF